MKTSRAAALAALVLLTAAARPLAAACHTHYFSSVQQDVGGGKGRVTQDEPSLAAFRLGPYSVGTNWVDVARFFSPVLSPTMDSALDTISDGKPIITLYVDKDGSAQMQGRVRLHDFDPATGTVKLIADALTTVVTGSKANAAHSVMVMPIASGTTIAAGHRLFWSVSYASANNPPNEVMFRFGGNTSPAFARVCSRARP